MALLVVEFNFIAHCGHHWTWNCAISHQYPRLCVSASGE
jgi:hypothetical protein